MFKKIALVALILVVAVLAYAAAGQTRCTSSAREA